ncbi:MAG: response regulator [Elusimicrobia bacterium]|nr:response regulator [Elusimicrobiota bacterium]
MISSEQILNARILIVEDDRTSRMLLKNILVGAGFQNLRAIPHAGRIVGIFRAFRPDLLLLDLHLPRIHGFEVMKRLREAFPDDYLPILVISADMDEQVRLRALSSGAKDFVQKPYKRTEVLLRARNLIETSLLNKDVQEKNRGLERLVQERTSELYQSRLDVIRRLGFAAEYRDTDTGIHIIRMSRYCQALALALGMNKEEAELILHTTPLHDVGKIAVPDRILLKEGGLNDEEQAVMRTHSAIGADILSGGSSDFLRMAEVIARTHHERWDGTGYPLGLKGEEIPLPGQICAICDVFDALTSERPYKKAWSFQKAAREIQRMSGSHFNPRIVDVFLGILPQIRAISRDVVRSYRSLLAEATGCPEASSDGR